MPKPLHHRTHEFFTKGEQLAGRALKQEKRGGVEHYVAGQMDVSIGLLATLSYVNASGHVVIIHLVKLAGDEEWLDLGVAVVAGQSAVFESKTLPDDWRPSKRMSALLRRAERRLKK